MAWLFEKGWKWDCFKDSGKKLQEFLLCREADEMEIVPSWLPAPAIGQNKSTCSTLRNAFSEGLSYVNMCISEGRDRKTRLARDTSMLVKICSVALSENFWV